MTDTLDRYLAAIRAGNVGLSARLQTELHADAFTDDPRLTGRDALFRAAMFYAGRGIAVFPCRPRGKEPLTEHGLKDATTDRNLVANWWSVYPNANIGAPTGITFDVVDMDGREGVLAVYGEGRELPNEIGHALTPREAGHHMFIEPTGRGNTTRFLPSVDYRGKGGYVILPPSIGANGARYRWARPLPALAT